MAMPLSPHMDTTSLKNPNGPLRSTIGLEQAADPLWDLLVIGAGPAGAMVAREVAQRSHRVLLVDRAEFPRHKVCGCCLNAAARQLLSDVGLGALPERLGARPFRILRLIAGKQTASVPLPSGLVLSREVLDAALVERAIDRGATWLSQTTAILGDVDSSARSVVLSQHGRRVLAQAKVVIVASGLGGCRAAQSGQETVCVEPGSRVGLGTVIKSSTDLCPADGVVMVCGVGGYVGMVRLPDGRLNVAAALDPALIQRLRGPTAVVQRIFEEAWDEHIKELQTCAWRGTTTLSRRSVRMSAERLLIVGDAAGYVEPFTGEGITWALASGVAAASFVVAGACRWTTALEARWTAVHRQLMRPRQRACRLIAHALRRTTLTRATVGLLSRVPCAALPMTRRINAPFRPSSLKPVAYLL